MASYRTLSTDMESVDEPEASDDGEEKVEKLSSIYRDLITTIDEDVDRQGLRKTPIRAARALWFFTRGYRQNLSGEWVVSLIISYIVPLRSSVRREGGASAPNTCER